MRITLQRGPRVKRGFSLVEVVLSMAVAGLAIAAMVGGFYSVLRSTESASYSLAANALALKTYEQVRAAKWDALSYPPIDEIVSSNFPPTGYVMDIPQAGGSVWATNYTTIAMVSTNPLLKAVRIDCVYRFHTSGLFTNTLVSYRSPDCGQQNEIESPPPLNPTVPPLAGTIGGTNYRAGATLDNNTWAAAQNDWRSRYGSGTTTTTQNRPRRDRNDEDD